MTRQEFIEIAKARGLDKQTAFAKYQELDAQGKFSDSSPVSENAIKDTASQPAPEQQGQFGDPMAPLRAVGNMVAAPFKEGYQLVKDSPQALSAMISHPGQYGIGALKGIANTGLGIVNAGLGAINSIATNPAVKDNVQPMNLASLAPSNQYQQIGSQYGKGALDAALMAVPAGKAGGAEASIFKKPIRAIEESASNNIKSVKEIKNIAKQTEEAAPKADLLSTLDTKERNILSEPHNKKDSHFTDYAEQAIKANADAREMTPMDMAGIKAKQAFDEIKEKQNKIGAKKGALIREADDFAVANGQGINVAGISIKWKSLLEDRAGASVDVNGNIKSALGRVSKINDEKPLVSEINKIISRVGEEATPIEIDDAKAAIQNAIDNYGKNQVRPVNTITEGIGKIIQAELDKSLNTWAKNNGFGKLAELNDQYGSIADVANQLNRRLGQVTDAETGQTRMGASLMKSAIMSNSDRGSKALFQQVKNLTGNDLIKESLFAKIAMDAVGDTRATDLLRSMSETKDLVKGISSNPSAFGAVIKIGEGVLNKARGDKITQLVNYYNKVQSPKILKKTEAKSLSQMVKR